MQDVLSDYTTITRLLEVVGSLSDGTTRNISAAVLLRTDAALVDGSGGEKNTGGGIPFAVPASCMVVVHDLL
jgi:hypothetical protein